jgi:hypothetical protein
MRWLYVFPLVIAVVLGAAGPAAAAARNYVDGADTLTDDWGNEPLIARGNFSNEVALWQAVLLADGELSSVADIDCDFGPRTHEATKRWQRKNGLRDDGVVGVNTWSKADDWIRPNLGYQVQYVGTVGHIWLIRHPGTYAYPYMYEMYRVNELKPVWTDKGTFAACV